MSVEEVLRLDQPQRICVVGQVHTIRPRFDLIKQIRIVCDNKKCKDGNKPTLYNLKSGLHSMCDLPYVFPGGPTAAERFLKCRTCGKFMQATPTQNRFQSARKIDLQHIDIVGNRNNNDPTISSTSINTTGQGSMKHIDFLTVRVSGIHASIMQHNSEVEMVGELLILPAGVESATRPTMQAGIRRRGNNEEIVFAENMGKYHKIFYADKIKYTSRAKQIDFRPERDTKAIRNFAAIEPDKKLKINMIDRLIAMFCPHIKGERLAKLAGLLQIAGASPIVKENWYDRTTVNLDFFSDVGTAKTEIGVHVTKVRVGSRIVLAQHASAKSIVAVAEKDPDGVWFVRPGPAILANGAILFIDELGAMRYWDDQDQFLQLMNANSVPFNKAGIDTVLYSTVSFLLAANPTTLNWQLPKEIQTGELPAKRTILDRSDMIIIFKDPIQYDDLTEVIDPNADAERNKVLRARAWADELDEAAGKHYNFDYVFLKKFFYYIHTSEQFKVVRFKNIELVHRLSDVWVDIKVKRPDLVGNRGVQSIRRIASCFARLMLKPEIDEEVVNETIKFVTDMYNRFGTDVTDVKIREMQITNDRDRMFYKVAENVKKFAEGHQWVMDTTDPNFGKETTDNTITNNAEVSFQSLIQKLCNDEINTANYFRLKLKSNQKTVSCNTRFDELRKMFLEKCGFSGLKYEGGILKVVNDRAPRGLVLKWEKSTDVNEYGDGINNGTSKE